MGYWDDVTGGGFNKDSLTIDGPDAFDLQDVPGDFGPDPDWTPEYPNDPPPELDPINNPPPFDGGGGDLEPPEASGLDPSIIAKLPAWVQQQLRNGNLSPSTALDLIRKYVPDFKLPGGSPGSPGTTADKTIDPALLASGLAAAWNHYKDSDRYVSMAEKYADRLDPFNSQRGMYQNRLAELMTDPESYMKNDPAYKSMLRLGVDPAMSKMRARGYGNSGNILSELTRLTGDVTNKYIGDLRKDLGNFSGAQFGPGAAASILGTGMQGSINSRNAALGDIFAGIMASGGTKPGSTIDSIADWFTRTFGGGGGGPPQTMPNPIITDPNDPGFIGPPAPGAPPGTDSDINQAPALDQNTPDSYFNKDMMAKALTPRTRYAG